MIPDWLKSALSDGEPVNPQVSMSRLIAFLTVLCVILLPMLLWFWLSCLKCELLDIPGGVVAFVPLASGVACAMFAANKRAE